MPMSIFYHLGDGRFLSPRVPGQPTSTSKHRRELFCSCQEEVQKRLLNERACTKVHYWDVVYLSGVEHSKSIGF